MFLLRLLGLVAAIAIGACAVLYLFTRERRHLAWAVRLARYAIAAALAVFALLLLERLAVLV